MSWNSLLSPGVLALLFLCLSTLFLCNSHPCLSFTQIATQWKKLCERMEKEAQDIGTKNDWSHSISMLWKSAIVLVVSIYAVCLNFRDGYLLTVTVAFFRLWPSALDGCSGSDQRNFESRTIGHSSVWSWLVWLGRICDSPLLCLLTFVC